MWLTRNEKRALKLLLDNAKLSDTSIAKKLNISSQAVGKIRRKLEENIINAYTLDLDHSKLDLNLLVLVKMYINDDGIEYGKQKIEKEIINHPHCIHFYKLFERNPSHIFISLFKDVDDLRNFIESREKQAEVNKFIKIDKIFQIPVRSILKSDSKSILHKAIDELGTKSGRIGFNKNRF